MTAPTHISFAGFCYLLLLTSAGVPLSVLNGITVLIASVLPDIDTGASTIGRLLPWASRRLERRFGHRTLTHSLPFTAAMAILLIPLAMADKGAYVCLLAGYASHPILDSCTMTGVRLFYPVSSVRCVFPMDVNEPMRYRINTGTRQETILAVIFLLACIPSFYVAYQGLQRFVRVTQANIEAAVKDFAEFSPTNLVWVECRASNLFTKERLVGRFRVIGALDAQTLVFQMPDGTLRTLGKEYRSDYAAEHAVSRKGEPARTVVERIEMSGRRASDIDTRGETHLFGRLLLSDEMTRVDGQKFAPIVTSGKEVRLNFATPADLLAFIGNAAIESGYLDVRHVMREPGQEPVTRPLPADACEVLKLQPDAELLFVCSPGDTVMGGGLLAAWDEQGNLRRELDEARKAVAALRLSRRQKSDQCAEKEGRLAANFRADSLALRAAAVLCATGFLAESAVRDADARLQLSRSARGALLSEWIAVQSDMDARNVALQNRVTTLESRLLPGFAKKELRSRTGGIVRSVERKESRVRITLRPR